MANNIRAAIAELPGAGEKYLLVLTGEDPQTLASVAPRREAAGAG
jgi:hypothetical protein